MAREKSGLRSFLWGNANLLQSPLRGGGSGSLKVGSRNCFGYSLAPRLGTGEILLQPRLPEASIQIGDGNSFSNNISLIANQSITIGNNCQIGDLVSVFDSDFHEVGPIHRNRSHGGSGPVSIGNNVWLASRVLVLKGVTIGDNSVVAAMSLVNRDLPPNCVAAGIPAKIIKSLE